MDAPHSGATLHTPARKSVRFLPLTAAALERVVATGDHMLPAGAATGRFCALQSATLGSVGRAKSVCARSATAKRPLGAQQWSSQQRAKSSNPQPRNFIPQVVHRVVFDGHEIRTRDPRVLFDKSEFYCLFAFSTCTGTIKKYYEKLKDATSERKK